MNWFFLWYIQGHFHFKKCSCTYLNLQQFSKSKFMFYYANWVWTDTNYKHDALFKLKVNIILRSEYSNLKIFDESGYHFFNYSIRFKYDIMFKQSNFQIGVTVRFLVRIAKIQFKYWKKKFTIRAWRTRAIGKFLFKHANARSVFDNDSQ